MIVKKQVRETFFLDVNIFIIESVEKLRSIGIPENEISIYMPRYFVSMFSHYFNSQHHMERTFDMSQYRGIKILDGYEDKVIVAYNDGVYRGIPYKEVDIR